MPKFYKEIHPWYRYGGKAGLLYDEGERIPGSATVVAKFLGTGYLWDYIRVMGGVYGGFCSFSPFSGFLAFLNYRDPNLAKTIDINDGAADALLAAAAVLENDPEALATAIIGTIGDQDGALSPNQKGSAALQRWLINETPKYRRHFRDEIMKIKASAFPCFCESLEESEKPFGGRGAFEGRFRSGCKGRLSDDSESSS